MQIITIFFIIFLILTLINYVKSTKIKILNIINFEFHSVKIFFLNKNFYFFINSSFFKNNYFLHVLLKNQISSQKFDWFF